MDEKNILKHLSDSINQAPIQLLETIKDKPRVKQLRHDEITRQKNGLSSMKFMTVVASVFVLASIVNFQLQYRTVDSRVYLDVNPSLMIESNRQNKVIDITALNPEGDKIIEDYKFKGRTLNQVTIDLVDKLVLSEYISNSDDLILVSVFNDDKEKAHLQKKELKTAILKHLKPKSIQPVILTLAIDQSNNKNDMASKYKISEGKLTLIRNIMNLSPKLKADVLEKLPLDQLVGLAKYMELDLSQVIEKQDLDKIVVPDAIKDIIEEDDKGNDAADDDKKVKDDDSDDDAKDDSKEDEIEDEKEVEKEVEKEDDDQE